MFCSAAGASVVADYKAKCSTGTAITLTTVTGYIVNHVAFNPSTRHAVCTWRVRVAPGQRIALTLYDFGRYRSHRTVAASTADEDRDAEKTSALRSTPRVSSPSGCRQKYAVIREAGELILPLSVCCCTVRSKRNMYVGLPYYRAGMYAGRVARCPLVSHGDVDGRDGQTDGRHIVTLRFLLWRRPA